MSLLAFLAGMAAPAFAHESRPGYLELRERGDHSYDVTWKQPANGAMVLRLAPVFPPECRIELDDDGNENQLVPGALVSRFRVVSAAGLDGETITIDGLDDTLTDVLVRLVRADGSVETHWAHSTAPSVEIAVRPNRFKSALASLRLGLDHIVTGADHLLFVLGLLLIVRERWMLLKTITSFTVAHSLTLAAAAFGVINVALPPLNAAIALSILFLGPEIVRAQRGETSLTIRHPWVVAFAFGLLHGVGFASGLTALGLSRQEIPLALLLFNLGVEAGQLLGVALVLLLGRSFRVLQIRWPCWAAALPAYTVGGLGAFWTVQRTAILLGALR